MPRNKRFDGMGDLIRNSKRIGFTITRIDGEDQAIGYIIAPSRYSGKTRVRRTW